METVWGRVRYDEWLRLRAVEYLFAGRLAEIRRRRRGGKRGPAEIALFLELHEEEAPL